MVRLLAVVILLIGTAASAHWKPKYASAPNASWYEAAEGCGIHCCGAADATRYDGNYTLNSDGSVDLADKTHLKACAVIQAGNPDGFAVLWKEHNHVYCFSPGAGS